ncbi:hypothetical protein [Providencia sp. M-27]|uniref:hypothetical protein n=1 Tax=Providencia sp. M-27 TaxID=2713150 RepID=UPI0014090773|nr:hypothetical protein [Providencia sp. M-27]
MDIKKRYDCILVWPHAIQKLDLILKDIYLNENFTILVIKKHKVSNFSKFVKKIYSFDYAPWHHLKEKTKYLRKVGNEVCFIFVENKNPEVELVDEGKFRHAECACIKRLKSAIREKYNPKDLNGNLSHHHVIHATDNEVQTYEMLKIAQLPIQSLDINHALNLPWFLLGSNRYKIKLLNVDDIYCRQNSESETIVVHITQSIQFKSLKENEIDNSYKEYIDNNIGTNLQAYYSIEKYSTLRSNFEYLKNKDKDKDKYIMVKKTNGQYIVVDGLHRASIAIKDKKVNKLVVCELYD